MIYRCCVLFRFFPVVVLVGTSFVDGLSWFWYCFSRPFAFAYSAPASIPDHASISIHPFTGREKQAAPSMPVLSSSDDDSDRENGESSGDDRIVRQVSNLSSGTADGQAGGNRTRSPVGDAGKGSGEEGRMASSHRLINQEVFFTTTDFYLVLRMHHLLAERLAVAKRLCRDARFSRQTVLASSHEVM